VVRPTEQIFHATLNGSSVEVSLPSAFNEVLPGVYWGAFDEIASPAYWYIQSWLHSELGTYSDLRLGRSLSEELAACLLGGYGMPADLGLAAYRRLREQRLIFEGVSAEQLESSLSKPFTISGRSRHYRFAKQKSRYLSACLAELATLQDAEGHGDVGLRDALTSLPGIGPKTASWIVRNYRGSDHVAIIDVHILRAGRLIGLFSESHNPQQHYFSLEQRFLELASAMRVRAALLDALIWDQMRRLSPVLSGPGQRAGKPASRQRVAKQGNATRDQLTFSI
jgi:thermostable 8-oxoguanine DNA glycosylase